MSDDLDGDMQLSPDDDAAVAALLGALPAPAMPTEVAQRVAAALAAEPPWSGQVPAWAAGGSDNVTVLPTAQERERRRGNRLRALTGVAASIVAVVAVVSIGVNAFDGTRGVSESSAGGAPGTAGTDGGGGDTSQQPTGALLVSTGTTYSAANLDAEVTDLVGEARVPGARLTAIPGTVTGASQSPSVSPSGPPVTFSTSKALVASLLGLDVCLRKLDRAGEQPIAADAGTWTGSQAVVLVLDGAQPARVDVYVVAPPCGDPADPEDHMLYFGSVADAR